MCVGPMSVLEAAMTIQEAISFVHTWYDILAKMRRGLDRLQCRTRGESTSAMFLKTTTCVPNHRSYTPRLPG